MNSDSHKDARERILRLLGDEHARNPDRKYGPENGRKVPCPRGHGHYVDVESCPTCGHHPTRKPARTRGQRFYEHWSQKYGLLKDWDQLSMDAQQLWEKDAADEVMKTGTAAFDLTYT